MKLLQWLDEPSDTVEVHFAPDEPSAQWPTLNYVELSHYVAYVSAILSDAALKKGDVVALIQSHPRDFIPAFFGVITSGGTACPLASPLTFTSLEAYSDHLKHIFAAAKPAVVFTDDYLVPLCNDIVQSLSLPTKVINLQWGQANNSQEIIWKPLAEYSLLQFTSGSTGTPKAVQVSRENLDANTMAITNWIDNNSFLVREDPQTTVSWLPFYHDMGLIGSLLTTFLNQKTLKLMTPLQFIRSPLRWLECLANNASITVSPSFGLGYTASRVTPEQIAHLDFSSLGICILGAERIDTGSVTKFLKLVEPQGFSPKIFASAYGLAESTLAVTGASPSVLKNLIHIESDFYQDGEPVRVINETTLDKDTPQGVSWLVGCGVPLEDMTVEIIDESGKVLPELYHGQIRVAGNSVTHGYRNYSGSSLTYFSDGYLYTGDSGFLYNDQLYVIGRIGDSIKIRGQKLFVEDVDARVGLVPGMRSGKYLSLLGVVGTVDVVAVLVESETDEWLPELQKALRTITGQQCAYAIFKGPRGIIERTSSGKPKRKSIWKNLVEGDIPAELLATNWEQFSTDPNPFLPENTTKGLSNVSCVH